MRTEVRASKVRQVMLVNHNCKLCYKKTLQQGVQADLIGNYSGFSLAIVSGDKFNEAAVPLGSCKP